jgi:hypothetical protein
LFAAFAAAPRNEPGEPILVSMPLVGAMHEEIDS